MILYIDKKVIPDIKIKHQWYVSILIANRKYQDRKQILITNSNIPTFSVKVNSKHQYKLYYIKYKR